ncbi:hypothetical protein [Streptomyces sp. NPDC020951]|uniref:hypothetical protein n=1 Tax=Streptomyces sp. NPDC020951 TaxID=3365104 RepID=UPI0037BA8FCE
MRAAAQQLMVAALAGGVVYLLAGSFPAAVLCAGLLLVIQVLVSMAQRLDDLKDTVDKRFADMGEATKLFGDVERLRGDGVPRLAARATEVFSTGPDILHEFAHAEIDRLAGLLEGLTNLSAECVGENHDWLLTLTRCARRSIDAVSTVVDYDGFWDTEAAGRYLTAQREASHDRRVRVRRLFIVRRSEESAALEPICAEQRETGIEVRVLALEQLPLHLRRGSMTDCIVFDEALTYEIRTDQLSVNKSTTVNARADAIQPLVRRFDQLWEAAAPGDFLS